MSFVPGHVSLTFAIWKDDDPLLMGSTGIGLVLPQGVHCAVIDEESVNSENKVICGGSIIEDPVTLRALELVGFGDKGLTIYLRHDLPLGSGFGISGASALAACMEVEKDMQLAIKAAHQAEVEFKTGLGDVMAISSAIMNNTFPGIVIREEPGYNGLVKVFPIKENFLLCISGLGRDTSKIIQDDKWAEIINSAALGVKVDEINLRSAIKVGRLFTEKTGLINDFLKEIFEDLPLGSVASVAHLGTSIIATSNNLSKLSFQLENFGEVRKY